MLKFIVPLFLAFSMFGAPSFPYLVTPTNAPVEGYVPTRTGDQNKWLPGGGGGTAFTNGLNMWVDAVYGSDSNSGLTLAAAVKTIAGLQAKSYFGYNLNFIGPATYTCPVTASLVLSNNNIRGWNQGVVITDAPNDSSTNSTQTGRATLYFAGGTNCIIENLEIRAVATNQLSFPIIVNGNAFTTNVIIRNNKILGYTDCTSWAGSTWNNPSSILVENNYFDYYWDAWINLPPSNSIVTVKGNVFDAHSDAAAPGVSGNALNPGSATWILGQAANGYGLNWNIIGNTCLLRSTNAASAGTVLLDLTGDGLTNQIVGNIFKVAQTVSNQISIVRLIDGEHYWAGNSLYYSTNMGITGIETRNNSAVAGRGLKLNIAGHPFNYEMMTYAKGKSAVNPKWINYLGDTGTNEPFNGAVIAVDGSSNRYYLNITNAIQAVAGTNNAGPNIGPGTLNQFAIFVNPTNVGDSVMSQPATNQIDYRSRPSGTAFTNSFTNHIFGEYTSEANNQGMNIITAPPGSLYDQIAPFRGAGNVAARSKFLLWESWIVNGVGAGGGADSAGDWLPLFDNVQSVGNSSKRPSFFFAGSLGYFGTASDTVPLIGAGWSFQASATQAGIMENTANVRILGFMKLSGGGGPYLFDAGLGGFAGGSNPLGSPTSFLMPLGSGGWALMTNNVNGAATPRVATLYGSIATGTDRPGGDLVISSGTGTGTGNPPDLWLATAGTNGTAGSTAQLVTNRVKIAGQSGDVTIRSNLNVNGTLTAATANVTTMNGGSLVVTNPDNLVFTTSTNGRNTNSIFVGPTFTTAVTNTAVGATKFITTDANSAETGTAASSVLAATLSDESGTAGVVPFFSLTGLAGGHIVAWDSVNFKWTNGAAPSGGSVSATTVTQTNFVLNTVYTMPSQSGLVRASVSLTVAGVNGQASMNLMADQAGGTTFVPVATNGNVTAIGVTLADTYTVDMGAVIKAGATYYWTNPSTGSGNSSSIVAGTGQIATISSGTNGAAGATGATGAAGTTPTDAVNMTNVSVFASLSDQVNGANSTTTGVAITNFSSSVTTGGMTVNAALGRITNAVAGNYRFSFNLSSATSISTIVLGIYTNGVATNVRQAGFMDGVRGCVGTGIVALPANTTITIDQVTGTALTGTNWNYFSAELIR